MSPVRNRHSFIKRAGRLKKSYTPKQSNNYKPSRYHKNLKTKLDDDILLRSDNDDVCMEHDEKFQEVLLSDDRCHDNTLRVRIGNVRAVALVDSGATISCISNALLCKLQPKRIKYEKGDITKIYGVGNIMQEISSKVKFNFHIGQEKFTHSFYSLHNQYPLILGMDFLTKHNGILDFGNSTITLNDISYDLTPPPRRSTLVKSRDAQIIDAYTSRDIPVILNRPVVTPCMLLESISSLTRAKPGLEVPLAVVSSQTTTCRITNDTECPIYISENCVVAIARNIALSNLTEMVDFLDKGNENTQHDSSLQQSVNNISHDDQADVRVDNDTDFNDIMPFPEIDNDASNDDNDIPEVTDNPKLSAQEIAELITFLLKNKKVFASTLAKLGYASEYYHKIETNNAKPVALRFYRTSPKIQREIDNQIEELLKYNIIEPSTSAWSSPVVMIKKPDGSYRFAVDFRQVNKISEPRNFPVPRLSDVFDQIGERKPQYFSTLDLHSGFWQIPVHPKDKDKTAFVTKNGKYVFNRMPFGLMNGPSTFQYMMTSVLKDLLGHCCCVYADDILVYSPDLKTHMNDLQKVFDRLTGAGLTLKPSKCHIAVQSVRYLGHILEPTGIRPNPDKVRVVERYPVPKNVTEVRRFLGLTQYYKRFQKDYSHVAKPLQNLTKNDVAFEWTDKCQKAFETMIKTLTTAPLLAYPDCNKPFQLSCDASQFAIGFILSQKDSYGVDHVIEYAGRSLRKSELNYSISDKEALAMVEGFRKFHVYLYSAHTTVLTDHQALEHVFKNPKISGRIARWNILLQNYDYTVVYKKGKLNANADAISRLENLPQPQNDNADDVMTRNVDLYVIDPDPKDVIEHENTAKAYVLFDQPEQQIPSVMPLNDIDIVKQQKDCPEIGPIYEFIETGEMPDNGAVKQSIIADAAQYFIRNNVLHHLYQPRIRNLEKHKPLTSQVVIPVSLRSMILREYHDSLIGAHQGFARTYAAIREKYYWPRMWSQIEQYVKTCYPC